jgi:hypothetical protein
MDEEEKPADLERRMRGRWILARRAPFNANTGRGRGEVASIGAHSP